MKKVNKKNYKLIALLDSVGGNRRTLSALLGISYITAANKVSGANEFTSSEIAKIKEHFGLTAEQVEDIFFKEA